MMNLPDPVPPSEHSASVSPSRRRIFLAAAGVAAVAGASLAWYQGRGQLSDKVPGPEDALWQLKWETPEGASLPMHSFKGKPLLLNFWATWCPPCVEELPLLDAFYRDNKSNGWQVLGLAVDKLAPVQAFLKKAPLHFPVGMAGLAGADLGRQLGNLAGGLPFTVVLGGDGSIAHRKMGRLSVEDLTLWRALK
jgi:thiol-disulfide isomerase/thioredoxin